MRFVVWVLVNAGAVAAATWLLPGITLTADTDAHRVLSLLLVAVVLGVINAVVRPVVKLVSLPFIILTLGLLVLVINAAMLLLTGWVSTQVGLGFRVDGFGTAVLGGVIVAVVTWFLELALREAR